MKTLRWYLRTTLAACAVATLATAMLFAFSHPALGAKPAPPNAPVVTSFAINAGAATTSTAAVALNNVCTGSPTHYMASESSKFTGAPWLAYSDAPAFLLSPADGTKTVYFKVRDAAGLVSATVSDTITLAATADPAFAYVTGESSQSWGDVRVMNVDGTSDLRVVGDVSSFSCSWSPDGQEIAFTGYLLNPDRTTTPSGVYAVRPDGSGLRLVTYGHSPSGCAWSPVPFEVGGVSAHWILYRSYSANPVTSSGELDIFAVRSDASADDPNASVNLTEGFDGWHYSRPTWSFDGTRFAAFAYYGSGPNPPKEIRVCTLADVNGQLQVSGIVSYSWPSNADNGGNGVSWARTQDKIATNIRQIGETYSRLAVLDLTTGDWHILNPPEVGNLQQPVWSPDDTQLAYIVLYSGIYVLEMADDSRSSKIASTYGSQVRGFDWLR